MRLCTPGGDSALHGNGNPVQERGLVRLSVFADCNLRKCCIGAGWGRRGAEMETLCEKAGDAACRGEPVGGMHGTGISEAHGAARVMQKGSDALRSV